MIKNTNDTKTPESPARRTFLKNAGVAAAAAALPVELCAQVAGSDSIRLGLVGCGVRGGGAAVCTLKADRRVRLVSMGDIQQAKIERLLEVFAKHTEISGQIDVPSARQHVGFDSYLRVFEEVDAVALVAPSGYRPLHFAEAVDRGLHIFAEKNLAVDVPGVAQMRVANRKAEEKGLKCLSGMSFRHDPATRECVDLVRQGRIGQVREIDSVYLTSAAKFGPKEPGESELDYQHRIWASFTWLGGGAMEWAALHIDKGMWIAGAIPKEISGSAYRYSRKDVAYENEKESVEKPVDIKFMQAPRGDRFDVTDWKWVFPNDVVMIHKQRNFSEMGFEWNMVIRGTEGEAILQSSSYELQDKGGKIIGKWQRPEVFVSMYQLQVDDWVSAILGNRNFNTIDFGIDSALACIAARTSAYHGSTMTLEEVLGKNERFFPEDGITSDSSPPTLPNLFGDYRMPAQPIG